jgi:hypothetical protein
MATKRILVAALVLGLASCGGSGGGGDGGPVTLDFEDRPDDGILPTFDAPLALGDGATLVDVAPEGTLADFSTDDMFGLSACDAEAFSGRMLLGVNAADAVVTIAFDPPVSRVSLYVAGLDPSILEVEAFDSAGVSTGILSRPAVCPSLREDDFASFSSATPLFARLEIRGDYLVFDDLSYE